MTKANKKLEVVKKFYFRYNGVIKDQGYDWIGKECNNHLYPVELNGKLGFADCNGEIVVPIIYDRQTHFDGTIITKSDTYLALQKNELYGLIKLDGTVVVEFEWEDMELWYELEDLIPVAINGKWGFVNVITGQTQVKPVYDEVKPFRYGFAKVCIENKWGVIDENGTVIIEPKYLFVQGFGKDDFTTTVIEGDSWEIGDRKYIIVNKKGYELFKHFSSIEKINTNTFDWLKAYDRYTKQFIAFPEYIVVIDNGEYIYKDFAPYQAKYIGGGTYSAIDYTGKPINIPDTELQKVKEALLAN